MDCFDIADTPFFKRRWGNILGNNFFNNQVETFKDWPISMAQKSDVLSKTGYFYTGRGDIFDKFEFLWMYSDKNTTVFGSKTSALYVVEEIWKKMIRVACDTPDHNEEKESHWPQ